MKIYPQRRNVVTSIGHLTHSLRREWPVTVSMATVTVLAIVDAVSGPRVVLAGLLAVGPCLTTVAGRPRTVLAVGAYALILMSVLSWRPDRIWGTLDQLLYVLAILGVTLVSVGVANQLRRLDEAARAMEGRRKALAAVVEQSDDAIVGTTLDGVVSVWNLGAELMFGYTAGETLGTRSASFTGPDADADSERDTQLARIHAGERGIRYDARSLHKDGHVFDVRVTLSPVLDDDGVLVGCSRIARDLTAADLAAASQRTAEASAQHSQRMASIGHLAGGVAHDFNNLLGVILNFTAFAAEQAVDNIGVRNDLEQVRIAAELAVGLSRQLLTFARLDTVQPKTIDVNVSIAETKAMLARTIGAHIDVIAVLSPTPVLVYADPGHIQQILVNLALNARDAMPDGGTLVIEATAADLDEGQPNIYPPPARGQYVRLLVSDTGAGMSADTIAHIFEPFFTTKAKGHGTGLGLATVHGIVAEAGGSINVYSEPGIGTTFRVYFPIVEASSQRAPDESNASGPPRGHGQTILVVEDEAALTESIVRILTGGGYKVLSADNGTVALERYATHDFDLLLTDVVMPGMSGRQLAARLQPARPDLRVLYMSGYTNGLLGSTRILDQGIAFIEKPFTERQLLVEIDTEFAATPKSGKPVATFTPPLSDH